MRNRAGMDSLIRQARAVLTGGDPLSGSSTGGMLGINTLKADFCVEVLQEALGRGRPEVFNTDRGSQLTSRGFTQVLRDHEARIGMDGKGRYADNIFVERLWRTGKYEEVYLKAYADAG